MLDMSCHAFCFPFDSVCPVLLIEFRAVRAQIFQARATQIGIWAHLEPCNPGLLTDLIYTHLSFLIYKMGIVIGPNSLIRGVIIEC